MHASLLGSRGLHQPGRGGHKIVTLLASSLQASLGITIWWLGGLGMVGEPTGGHDR